MTNSEKDRRIIVSISVQKAGVPHSEIAIHLVSADNSFLTQLQASHAVETLMGVLCFLNIDPYSILQEEEIKKQFEEWVAKGLVDKDGNHVIPQPIPSVSH